MLEPATIAAIAKLLGLSVPKFAAAVKRAYSRSSEAVARERAAAFIAAGGKAITEGSSSEFLRRFYTDDALQAGGLTPYRFRFLKDTVRTTVATRADWIHKVELRTEHEECLFTTDDTEMPKPPECSVIELLRSLDLRGVKIWNAPLYRLVGIKIADGRLNAEFALDEFYRYRITNGALGDELIQGLIDVDFNLDDLFNEAKSLLPLRHAILPDARKIGDFKSRLCSTGINIVTAIARPPPYSDYAIILQRRSGSVSTRQQGLSVVPAGIHQPCIHPGDEVAISCTVFREVFEELFGGEDRPETSKHLVHDWYYKESAPIKWLLNHTGAYSLLLTGFGVSTLSGSCTFSVLLAIHDEHFWKKFRHLLRTNWEVTDDQMPIFSTKSPQPELLLRKDWTDSGLFSLIEGLLELQKVGRLRCKRLDLERLL